MLLFYLALKAFMVLFIPANPKDFISTIDLSRRSLS